MKRSSKLFRFNSIIIIILIIFFRYITLITNLSSKSKPYIWYYLNIFIILLNFIRLFNFNLSIFIYIFNC
jgi:hypothetical protein